MYIVITSRSRGPQSPQSPQWPQGPQRLATTCTHHVFGQRNQPTTFCIQISNQISGGPPNRVQHRFWVPACPCLQGPTPPSLTKLPHLEPTTHLHIKPTPKHPNSQRQRFFQTRTHGAETLDTHGVHAVTVKHETRNTRVVPPSATRKKTTKKTRLHTRVCTQSSEQPDPYIKRSR